MTPNKQVLSQLSRSIETWDESLLKKSLTDAIKLGLTPDEIISEGLAKGMEKISDRFNNGEIYLPHVLAASKVMESAMDLINKKIPDADTNYRGVVVMGTVSGDIHEIGKNVCVAMLRGARYNVIDLGPDVSPEQFVEAVKKYSPDIVGGSALMTTTLDVQRRIVNTMKEYNCNPLLLFGGAPCTQEWVDSINGDGYSASGHDMVLLVNRMLKDLDKKR